MKTIHWSKQSVDDLEAIHGFIARDSEIYALRVIKSLIDAVEQVAAFPRSGRPVPERPETNLRELIRPPYRIIDQPSANQIEIVSVFHSSRLLEVDGAT